MDIKRIGWFLVSTLIIVGMLYLADFNEVVTRFQEAEKLFLISGIFVGLLAIPVWTNSWYHLLRRVGARTGFYDTLRLFTAGNFLNAVTPLGQFGGEPLMAYVIEKNTSVSYEDALSAVISADMINALPILTFVLGGAIFLIFSGAMTGIVMEIVSIALVITVLGGSLAYLLWFRSGTIESGIVKALRKLTGILGRGSRFVDGLEARLDGIQEAFRAVGEEPRELVKVSIIAHLFFVFQVLSLYLVMLSVGIETDITPLYFVLPMASLANFSPTPGGSGTYEAVMAGILTTFLGIGGSASVTIAILYRFTTFWPSLLIGYVSFTTISGVEDASELKDRQD